MSIELALSDAAKNCAEQGATAIVTLRSGAQLEGSLQRDSGADLGTRHFRTSLGGWITFCVEEVAAVEAKPARGIRI
jgi:hypothetical protein